MKFEKLIEQLNQLNLPKSQYAITSSGSMAVRGIREASDLDIIVTDDLWNQLSQKYPVIETPPCDKIQIGQIEILGNWSHYTDSTIANVNEQIKTADNINGHRFVNLDLVKKFKQKLARGKDLIDIKLIDQYLALQDR